MNAVCRDLRVATIWVLVFVSFVLAACDVQPDASYSAELLMATPAQTGAFCEACAQATLSAALTQEKNNADNQAAATAAIARANAQATLNASSSTLSAAQTQEQSNANVIAAQVAATAAIVRANAQATLIAAGSTQNAALTQDAIQQTQMASLATIDAQASAIQRNKDDLAASTQTAVADNIATQTQSAAATSQWYADQSRQRAEQRQGPIAFLWMWCLPIFIVLLAGLVLWGFWRWLKIREANQSIFENPVDKLPALAAEVIHHQQNDFLPYLESEIIDNRYQFTRPDDQVRRWLDEVKRKLLSSDRKDEDDNTAN
jgi:cobalamin biosynthesis Mg chelatase CobN